MAKFLSKPRRAWARLGLSVAILSAAAGLPACVWEIEPETRAPIVEPGRAPALSPTLSPDSPAPTNPASATFTIKPTPPVSVSEAGPCITGKCHIDLHQKDQRFKHKPYVDERCLDCHADFHKPTTQLARVQMELDLCYTCHPRQSLGNTHPVGEGVIDPNTKQMMTCTSTCHRSHTAPYRYLLILPAEGALCVHCHKEFLK